MFRWSTFKTTYPRMPRCRTPVMIYFFCGKPVNVIVLKTSLMFHLYRQNIQNLISNLKPYENIFQITRPRWTSFSQNFTALKPVFSQAWNCTQFMHRTFHVKVRLSRDIKLSIQRTAFTCLFSLSYLVQTLERIITFLPYQLNFDFLVAARAVPELITYFLMLSMLKCFHRIIRYFSVTCTISPRCMSLASTWTV